jgi:hypothetical protein
MSASLQDRLAVPLDRLQDINAILTNPDMRVISDLMEVVEKYGTPEEINRRAVEAREPAALLDRIRIANPDYLQSIGWLQEVKNQKSFIPVEEYRQKILGDRYSETSVSNATPVTLEVSACQYFPWLITAAKNAIRERSLLPGRFIRVRKMKEQEEDGDLPAFALAMQIIGASYVETLDTKGTDGANIHLGGPETITGYFGGVGQPNEYAIKWIDEFLYYYTNYGVQQVLNLNPGTVFLGYMLHRLGVDIEFKISVFMGNDNPYAAFWTLVGAKLFAREDGSSPLIGFNWSNSVQNSTMEISDQFRHALGFEENVRFEHHITETYKSIVRQPYNRRAELMEIAGHVANISAKHEGGDPEVDSTREHPSDILDYFRDKAEIIESGDWEHLTQNFLDKVEATSRTADELTRCGLAFLAAAKLHHLG